MGINSSQRKKDEQIKGQMDERTKIRVVIENTHCAVFYRKAIFLTNQSLHLRVHSDYTLFLLNKKEGVRGSTVYDFPLRLGASQVT